MMCQDTHLCEHYNTFLPANVSFYMHMQIKHIRLLDNIRVSWTFLVKSPTAVCEGLGTPE